MKNIVLSNSFGHYWPWVWTEEHLEAEHCIHIKRGRTHFSCNNVQSFVYEKLSKWLCSYIQSIAHSLEKGQQLQAYRIFLIHRVEYLSMTIVIHSQSVVLNFIHFWRFCALCLWREDSCISLSASLATLAFHHIVVHWYYIVTTQHYNKFYESMLLVCWRRQFTMDKSSRFNNKNVCCAFVCVYGEFLVGIALGWKTIENMISCCKDHTRRFHRICTERNDIKQRGTRKVSQKEAKRKREREKRNRKHEPTYYVECWSDGNIYVSHCVYIIDDGHSPC